MARFTVASALLAVASVVSAQNPTAGYDAINKPADGETVQAGTTYTITWTPAAQYSGTTVKLAVIGGQTQGTQTPLYTIGTADNAAGQLSWSVDCAYSGLPFYGLTITDASDSSIFQYSSPFKIVSSGACNSQPSSSASSSATVTATLSSVSSHSTVTSNTTVVTTSSCSTSTYPATTVVSNYNNTKTTFSKTPAVVTATSYSTANATAAVTSHPSTVVTSGASSIGGSIVMLAGVAAAFFVL